MVKIVSQSAGLDDAAEIHHGDPVAHVLDHAEIMADHDVGKTERFLEFEQQVDDLGADGDIECRDRLIENDDLRPRISARAMPIRWR